MDYCYVLLSAVLPGGPLVSGHTWRCPNLRNKIKSEKERSAPQSTNVSEGILPVIPIRKQAGKLLVFAVFSLDVERPRAAGGGFWSVIPKLECTFINGSRANEKNC